MVGYVEQQNFAFYPFIIDLLSFSHFFCFMGILKCTKETFADWVTAFGSWKILVDKHHKLDRGLHSLQDHPQSKKLYI